MKIYTNLANSVEKTLRNAKKRDSALSIGI
jgi:hypothetical protein